MEWHEIADPADAELDRLAARYNLHALHIEDCRHRDQRAKVENGDGYLFVVLKPVSYVNDALETGDVDVFIGPGWVITVQETANLEVTRLIQQTKAAGRPQSPDQVLYRLADMIVDAYTPALDAFDERLDELEEAVLRNPTPECLAQILSLKREMIDMRRVMANMRDVANHLQRAEGGLIRPEMQPFYRDVYDHLARNLDLIEGQRDLTTGALDVYLSSIANRTNQVMKVLSLVGTVTLPVLLISSIYGMNIQGLPWADLKGSLPRILAVMALLTTALLAYLKLRRWL
jgi:magnesium transporter